MPVVASQLAANISIQGAQQAQATFASMASGSNKAQANLSQLQSVAQEVSNVVQNKFAAALRSSQAPLQALAQQAADAGIDTSKLSDLQAKAAVAADNLAVAQDRAAAALQKAANITIDAASSEAQITAAQNQASLAADKVAIAENAAAAAMSKLGLESETLSSALATSSEKSSLFSTAMGGMKEGASGFLTAFSEAPGKLLELGQNIGFAIFGIQQFIQVGQQAAAGLENLGKKAGDFQQGITQLSTGAGELQSNLGMVSDGILKMAPEVGTTTTELTAGMYQIESAGQHGAAALVTLQDAAEGAKTSNSALKDVANGVTTEMTDYIAKNVGAAQATNTLIESVKLGKSNIGDMSKSMATILPTSAAVGVSLTDTAAAMSTMTHEGTPAADAATYLKATLMALEAPSSAATKTLASIGLTSQQVSDEMKVSLPGALELIVDHLKTQFPEGSAAYVNAMKNIVGGTRGMQGILELTGANLTTFEGDVTDVAGAVKTGGSSISGWTQVQQDFNFEMQRAQEGTEVLGITLGTKLFPIFTQVFGWVASTAMPALNNFSHWFFDDGIPALQSFFAPLQTAGKIFDDFVGHGQAAIPILAGIGAVIAGLLVPAIWSVASGVIAATWPVLAVAAAVAGLTAVFLHFYNTSAGFRDFLTSTGIVLRQIGSFIAGVFTPVWQQLQEVWSSQLQPALQEVWNSLKQLQPELTIVGEIVGGVLLGAVVLIIGEFGAMIGALGGMMHGVAEVIGGVVQIVSGFIQTIAGIVAFIIDLFTGNFGKLGGDLKTILGGVGEIFSGFGNVLKGIVDGIIGGVVGGFKGMATTVIGTLTDLVTGVDNNTKKASISAQLNTAQMKDKSIENAQKMNEGTQNNLINMRNGIEEQLKQTTDAAQKHTLEMKLNTINNSLEMAQATGRNIVDMRTKSQEQLDLLKQGVDTSMMSAADKAKYHSLNMKDMYLQGVISMDNDSIKRVDEMRLGILDELSRTTDGAKKQSLETQLTQVTNAENTAKKVKDAHVKMRTDTESELDKLKKSIADKSAGIMGDITGFFGGIGKWFTDRWHDVQGAFGNTGQWFHDRWNEAWTATTTVFGNIGGWFTDRWHDIQGVFGSIGKWFGDRWNDVMNSTKPFRDYMGDVFQTIWNILVALWGKLGKWFQDRFGEVNAFLAPIGGWFHDHFTQAWNAVVGAFQFLGKWFSDRWTDVKNIFGGVGQWFHDRWQEAWNKTVEVFTPIGKWFGDRWTDVKNIWGGIGQWFHDRGQEAWNKITQVFGPIGKWFGDRWNEIKTNISNKWNEIKTDASTMFKGIINGIIDQLNNGIQAFATFVNFFGQKLDDLATSLNAKPTIPMVKFAPIPHYAAGTDSHPGGPAIVGEKGREMVWLPQGAAVAPNDITEKMLSMFKGKIPGYADGVGDIGSKIMDWVAGGAKSILDNLISTMHITAPNILGMSNIAGGMFDTIKKYALSWIGSILPAFNASTAGGTAVNVPGNVASWIAQAMALTHVPSNWATDLGVIAMHESGGSATAVNRTDSNALAGHPSQGLFQTIPSTFAAHMLPGHTNILNPVDNAASAIEYIIGRYGDVFHVPGIVSLAHGGAYQGYANGGIINEPIAGIGLRTGTNYAFGENGKELVTPYVPSGVNLAQHSQAPANITIIVQPNDFNIDGRRMNRALEPYRIEDVRRISGANI